MRSPRPRRRLEMLLGALAGLLVLELALRPFTTALQNDWRNVPIAADSVDGPVTEVRYYHEGLAVSHFSPAHARLTDNPRIAGAPTGVILGDSYVEALQVVDDETMGAVVERAARSAGRPLNVRQYGWSGESVSHYVKVAPELLARWHPSWVAVVVNEDDFPSGGVEASCGPDPLPRAGSSLDSVVRTSPVHVGNPGLVSRLSGSAKQVWRHSRLAYEIGRRVLEITSSSSSSGDATGGLSPCEALRQLRAAYADKLVVVYIATVSPADDGTRDATEDALLLGCASQGIACLSTRDRMVQEQRARQQFARGFANTAPNMGHPNALGHWIIGEELWQTLVRQPPSGLMARGRN